MWTKFGCVLIALISVGFFSAPFPTQGATLNCEGIGGECTAGLFCTDTAKFEASAKSGTSCESNTLLKRCCVPKVTGGACDAAQCKTIASCSGSIDSTKSCSGTSNMCCSESTASSCPSGICVNDEGSCTNGVDETGSCTGQVCCKAAGTSCSGKDSSGAAQTGTCSTTATCSSGTALTSATGCSSGKACCYSGSTTVEKCVEDQGGTCEMVASCTGTPLGQFDCSTGQTCCKTQVDPSTASRCFGENPGVVPCGRSCDDPSTGDVDESQICTLCHLFLLMKNITSWIFMVMTYIAFAVLVAMGVLYIVSAGNTQMIGLAKSGIKAALYGFAIVLLGWVAINVILMVLADGALGTDTATFSFKTNGSWFKYSCDAKSKYVRTGIDGVTSGTGNGNGSGGDGSGGGTVTCGTGACAKDAAVKAAVQSQTSMPANDYMAILQAGEHYGQTSTCSKASSPTGACGVSQTMPSNYKSLCGFSSCEAMRADINKDIACGAKVAAGFKSSHNVRCVDDSSKRIDCTIDSLKSLAGCYNRGYHCNISPRNVSGKWYDCGEFQGGKSYCDRVSEYASSCT